jgi:hypothetical protein|tara:strand:- start:6515 stop:7042 length:528 start_codon:yes stop_codon:yes gene_type:complete
MWYHLKYDYIRNILPHIVQEDLLDWHREYIDKKYSVSEVDCEEVTEIKLDPGGIMLQDGNKLSIDLDNGSVAIANLEHVLGLVELYFCDEEMLETKDENRSNIMAKIVDGNTVKVYTPYACLVMSLDNYNKIYNALSDNYARGFDCYIDMLASLSGAIDISAPPVILPDGIIPEA